MRQFHLELSVVDNFLCGSRGCVCALTKGLPFNLLSEPKKKISYSNYRFPFLQASKVKMD